MARRDRDSIEQPARKIAARKPAKAAEAVLEQQAVPSRKRRAVANAAAAAVGGDFAPWTPGEVET
ncbi:MAG TPA: endonuclease III, partial [Ancylobacter sp.]